MQCFSSCFAVFSEPETPKTKQTVFETLWTVGRILPQNKHLLQSMSKQWFIRSFVQFMQHVQMQIAHVFAGVLSEETIFASFTERVDFE